MQAFEFIGGVPLLLVPDQTRALIARPDPYEPQTGRTVEEFATHYGVAVLPARPGRPRDKPKVEAAVLLVERWILARLRNRRFMSLAALNAAIAELLVDLNARPFKKLPGCRASAFEALDRPALRPLPATRFEVARWKAATVFGFAEVNLPSEPYPAVGKSCVAPEAVSMIGTVPLVLAEPVMNGSVRKPAEGKISIRWSQ